MLPREAELAREFEVSRQAVREALKVLAAKGLLASRRRTGTTVLPRTRWNLLDPDVLAWCPPDRIPPEFLADLVESRQLIEPAAAAMAARRTDPERLARLKAALDSMRANISDVDALLEADIEFHGAMLTASGNSLFDRLSTIIRPALETTFALQAQASREFDHVVEQHAAVCDAIARGDAEAAAAAMRTILTNAHGYALQAVRDHAIKDDLDVREISTSPATGQAGTADQP